MIAHLHMQHHVRWQLHAPSDRAKLQGVCTSGPLFEWQFVAIAFSSASSRETPPPTLWHSLLLGPAKEAQ